MKRQFLALSFGLGAMILATDHAFAQAARNCAPHGEVVARLAERFGEVRQSIALGSNNTVVEVFASVTTGTWTITVTNPAGLTCLAAAGNAYEAVAEALPPAGNPA